MPLRILIADDDVDDQLVLKEALCNLDSSTQVFSVLDAKEALVFLNDCSAKELPCLMVIDLNMPLLNGPDLVYLLQKDPRFAAIPKVIWSTSGLYEDIMESIRNGALRFFIKPLVLEDTIKMAGEMLSLCSTVSSH